MPRFVIRTNAGDEGVRVEDLDGEEIRVGRGHADQPGGHAAVNLDADPAVSFNHARVFLRAGRWFIEDTGSTNGTVVGGREIRGEGPVRLTPESLVYTGSTTWLLIPPDWFLTRNEEVFVFGECTSALHYAAYHCGIPVVHALAARNMGKKDSAPWRLRLQFREYSEPVEIQIPKLPPEAEVFVGTPFLRLRGERLRNQVEPDHTQLRVQVDGVERADASMDISVLGFWDWLHDRTALKSIAAFVSPHNPIVERIVGQASKRQDQASGMDSFESLLRARPEDGEKVVLECLYRCIAEERKVSWMRPELKSCPSHSGTYQTIRPPHRIFQEASAPVGRATCLDLALLLAGCIEHIGLYPLIIFTGERDEGPRHAFVGCWSGTTPGERPVIGKPAFLQREVRAGNMFVVESTGAMCQSVERPRQSFVEASADAFGQLRSAEWVCAVDIGAVRPPHGVITPLDCPSEPETAKAFVEARKFAREKGRKGIETACLLYGLLTVAGEVTRALFAGIGMDTDQKRKLIDDRVQRRKLGQEPLATLNYAECERLAEMYAWHAGVRAVREQDLWWALLEKGARSTSLHSVCRLIGTSIADLREALPQTYPRPRALEEENILTSGKWSSIG